MLPARPFLGLIIFSLAACNGPTLSPERQIPVFPSANYDHLDCHQLRIEVKKINAVIEQLSGAKNEPRYVIHTEMPFIGTGDNMGAIELFKSKAELNALKLKYENKNCANSAN